MELRSWRGREPRLVLTDRDQVERVRQQLAGEHADATLLVNATSAGIGSGRRAGATAFKS